MRLQQILFFWLITVAVLGLGHVYLYRRLVRSGGWSARVEKNLRILLVVLGALVPALLIGARLLPRDLVSPFAFVGYVWLGLLSSVFSVLVLSEFVRLALRLSTRGKKTDAPDEPARRRLFERVLSGGIVATGAALTGVGMYTALTRFRLEKLDVALDRLPAELDGFRIVQLSDIHVGPTIGRDFMIDLVKTVNDLSANLVVITGDLVDGKVSELGRHTEPLENLKSSYGTYFVTGNHEYYSGADEWIDELERLGITTLRNERVEIGRYHGGLFDLAGVTDHRAAQFGDGPDYERALGGRDETREVVLLAHQPAAVREAEKWGVGLQLSGHTHAGQFWPWNWVVHLVQPVVRGLARFGRTQVYVNQGTGYWGPPVRVGTEPEITIVTLRSKPLPAAA